jgi:hypothetical protein
MFADLTHQIEAGLLRFFLLVVIVVYHELGLNRPVSASSNSLFKGLPSRLRQFGL